MAQTKKQIHLPSSPESIASVLAEKCYKSTKFRQDLKSNSVETISNMFNSSTDQNIELKNNLSMLNITPLENTSKRWHVVLPPVEVSTDEILNEDQLEQVVGGIVFTFGAVAGAGVALSGAIATGTAVGAAGGTGAAVAGIGTAVASGLSTAVSIASIVAAIGLGVSVVGGVVGSALAGLDASDII